MLRIANYFQTLSPTWGVRVTSFADSEKPEQTEGSEEADCCCTDCACKESSEDSERPDETKDSAST